MSFLKELAQRRDKKEGAQRENTHHARQAQEEHRKQETARRKELIAWFATTDLSRQISEALNNPQLVQFLLYILNTYSKKGNFEFFKKMLTFDEPKVFYETSYAYKGENYLEVTTDMYVVLKRARGVGLEKRYCITMKATATRNASAQASGRIEFQIPIVREYGGVESPPPDTTEKFVSIEELIEFALNDLSSEAGSVIAAAAR
jgi:hypothetical protein